MADSIALLQLFWAKLISPHQVGWQFKLKENTN
jgi:hypothetical protein